MSEEHTDTAELAGLLQGIEDDYRRVDADDLDHTDDDLFEALIV
jgi:hypothetical protein